MALTNETVKEIIIAQFGESIINWEEPYGMLTFTLANKEQNVDLLNFLFQHEQLQFQFLTDICAVHYPDNVENELAVVYHLHNLIENIRIRFKVFTNILQPDVNSATSVFPGANWMERETYDFFGVNFIGHPDLRRILNVDEMDYFPLRKQYPVEDQTRIDKDDEMFGRGGGQLMSGI
ncbi:NADH-quinone oxidoreductase subunit C [Polluticaenibacter yanchengensis]|uniref:NADH-quinone oxidoreductase n=1 Tax=Polluticaenibacter yanchengensis TaxID=3014562 RepID=A0ABT4UEY1_9BACT|nr:NADH-quinone oxidoreductase subunit C [Chitinophagaceae bacterium LY-5]